MSTDFTKNAVSLIGGISPSSTNTPGDIRCRVTTEADIFDIPNPYIGMVVYVLDSGKKFEVLTLKSKRVGLVNIENAAVDTYRDVTVDLTKLATKNELHSHINLDLLSNISETDIANWNAKVDLSQVPTKVSQLENDLSFVKEEAHLDLCALVESEIERAKAAELDLSERVNLLEGIDHSLFALKKDVDAKFDALQKHKLSGLPKGTLVDYRDKEIRIMVPKDAVYAQQQVGEGGNPNMYYMSMTTDAPEGAVAFNEGDKGVVSDMNQPLNGKKSKTIWLALAMKNGDVWTYFGKNSSVDKYIGWSYIIEWLDAEGKVIETNTVRINLSNEECHNELAPYPGFRIAGKIYVDEQISTHEHTAISEEEIEEILNNNL